jgi:hypothetical protein
MKKTLTATILTALTSLGGMFGYYDNKLAGAEAIISDTQIQLEQAILEKDVVIQEKEAIVEQLVTKTIEKNEVLKDFIYSQVRLHETPTIDLTFATPTEIQQAYIDLTTEKSIVLDFKDNAFDKLRLKAINEGSACIIK